MQLFKFLPQALLAILIFAAAPAMAQQTEEKEETQETEIIVITETIDEHGNKNVNKSVRKGNFTEEEIERIVEEESGEKMHTRDAHDNEFVFEHQGHHEGHERGFLGVNIEDAAGQGARITGIVDGSPAASSGLASGDVITSVNGEAVENTGELIEAIGSLDVGVEVEIAYTRVSTPGKVKVKLDERPEADMEKALEEAREFEWEEKAEAKDKPRLGVFIDEAENGVEITEVSENSLAETAGLASGDIITSFNGKSVSNPDELIDAVQNSPAGEAVEVKFFRDGESLTRTVTFAKK